MKQVKLFGCRHSGTKYLTRLLEINWNVEVPLKEYGHKHEKPGIIPDDVLVIVIYKHPAAYIASVRDRLVDREPHRKAWGDRRPVGELIGDYTRKHTLWLDVADCIVHYEDLLFDFQNTMKRIEESLNLKPQREKYKNVEKYCGNPRRTVKREYYKNKKYKEIMTDKDWKTINKIPDDLMKKLGF